MGFTDILLPDHIRNMMILKSDPLYDKLNEEEQESAIEKARQLGIEASQWILENYRNKDSYEVLKELKVPIIYEHVPYSKFIPYSIYRPKNKTITLYVNVVNNAVEQLYPYTNIETHKELLEKVTNVILFHELFHHLEQIKFGSASKLMKTTTIDFGIFHLKSGIKALSEIAAHTFSIECIGSVHSYLNIISREAFDDESR